MARRGWVAPLLLARTFCAPGAQEGRQPDPAITIPFCKRGPTLDGKLEAGEWDFAAGIGMLESYYQPVRRTMRAEQVLFYLCWDKENLYVAMDSLESPLNRIMARCVQNDNMGIIGDDCLEVMVAPGDIEAVRQGEDVIVWLNLVNRAVTPDRGPGQ
jgi:hypothetical protein